MRKQTPYQAAEKLYLRNNGRATLLREGSKGRRPVAVVASLVLRKSRWLMKRKGSDAALERGAKQVLYWAVGVFFIDMCLVVVARMAVLSMAMAMQAQQQLVRHHDAAKQQEQKQGDICRELVHLYLVS